MPVAIAKNEPWREQEALKRFQIISPLIQPDLDAAKQLQLRKELTEQHNLSVRTLYRYEKAYREQQFSGLKPAERKAHYSKKLPANYDDLLQEAILLKREVPERSVRQIIYILELEGRVAPGVLKRSTLQRHLYEAGYGRTQMQMYKDARKSSSKRFCKPHRMMLIQGDIKYGCKLPIGKKGAKVQVYLSSALDDHSRFPLASQWYDNQEESAVEDTFRKAITRYGKFDACYFDNGKQYVAKQLNLALSKLGIRIRFTPKNSGKSKGKIEKFHQVVDDFLRESRLKNIRTLEELNRYWRIYLEAYYEKIPHEGIAEYYTSLKEPIPEGGISPLQEFNRDSRPLVYIDTAVVAEAFRHHETRKVNKGACVSFGGKQYETKPALIGFNVEISYDPNNPEDLTVHYPGMEPFQAKPLKIGEFCDKNPTLPVCMQEEKPKTSRLLDALEKKYEEDRKMLTNAISFGSYRKEAD
jgi:transposase InsO family protein